MVEIHFLCFSVIVIFIVLVVALIATSTATHLAVVDYAWLLLLLVLMLILVLQLVLMLLLLLLLLLTVRCGSPEKWQELCRDGMEQRRVEGTLQQQMATKSKRQPQATGVMHARTQTGRQTDTPEKFEKGLAFVEVCVGAPQGLPFAGAVAAVAA